MLPLCSHQLVSLARSVVSTETLTRIIGDNEPMSTPGNELDSQGSIRPAYDVFISFNSADLKAAEEIYEQLRKEGWRPWKYDRDSHPGESWAEAIGDQLDQVPCAIFLLSKNATKSDSYVLNEITMAFRRKRKKPLHILRFDLDGSPLTGEAEFFFSRFTPVNPNVTNWRDDIPKLIQAARRGIGEVQPPPGYPESGAARIVLLYKRGAHPDEQLLRWLEGEYTARGHQVFIDRHLTVGMEWATEIGHRIREADVVIPLLSPASVQSEELAGELEMAREEAEKRHGKPRLLPIRVNYEKELPPGLAVILDRLQYFLWKGPQDSHRLMAELVNALLHQAPVKPIPRPEGAVQLDSQFYIVRPTDRAFQEALARRDSVVLIRGARQVGKTSLLARGLQQARAAGARVVLTDFQKLNASDLESTEKFFRTLGGWVARQLKLDVSPDDIWSAGSGPSMNFTDYVLEEVLEKPPSPLVWAMDEVDRLFTCPFASEVFGLFRSWYNDRVLSPHLPWDRLTLAIAYATEAHLFITDMNQSPFNVGTRLALEDFTPAQVAELNRRYGSPLRNEAALQRFYGLVGGHPYLANRGLYEMAQRKLGLPAFEAEAEREDGIFGDHLRRILVLLAKDSQLCDVVRAVLRGQPCATDESFYRLRSGGVMTGDSARDVRPRCQLYARYLERHL